MVGYRMATPPPSFPGCRNPPGFRMSVTDGVILATGGLAGWFLSGLMGTVAALFPVVVAHFFLFCNVFRVRRLYELWWAAVFVVNFAAWSMAGAFSWRNVMLTQTPLTLLLIGAEIVSPRYHGVGYGWIQRRRMVTAAGHGASDDTRH